MTKNPVSWRSRFFCEGTGKKEEGRRKREELNFRDFPHNLTTDAPLE
ncbi:MULTISPECIES: hypothetical protein [unclassified Microcoleus]